MNRRAAGHSREAGFSLVELMITLVVFALVVAAVMVVMATSTRSKQATEGLVEAQQSARATLDIMARDIRSAGYGVDKDNATPQPAFAYVDSQEIMIYANEQPAPRVYDPSSPSVGLAGQFGNSSGSSAYVDTTRIQAPSPTGTPLPPLLTGGYALTTKWRTGAELIRYTLDINDDGAVNSSDQNSTLATDAQRTQNPNDYLLVRRVYGDKSGSVPTTGNNGGAIEKVGLVDKPGGSVGPLFTVYIGSNPLPWNWANGPIPASQLNQISRVTVNVTAESRSPDKNGNYAKAQMSTDVNSLRNVPEAGNTYYTCDGYVYDDKDHTRTRTGGDVAIPGVVVRMGTAGVAQTNSVGYYTLTVAPGQYLLKQEVPQGYGPEQPDSFSVDFVNTPTNIHHDFADTARVGGWLTDTVYVDANANGFRDAGDYGIDHATISVGGQTAITDGFGAAKFFLSPGSYAVNCFAPDSFHVSTLNPVPIVMVNTGTARADFGVQVGVSATIQGNIYKDLNKNGVLDAGEPGVYNVWVAVTTNSGGNVIGFAYTDASGNYSITVPANDPPHTTPYEITYQLPTNYYATTTTMHTGIYLTPGQTLTGKNFGTNTFQVISLTADRVLSLGSAELMEKDWAGGDNQYDAKSHKDIDLVLGSEWVSNPNISVWWNQYPASTLFNATPSYQVNAQSSALSLAIGPLNVGLEPRRPDVVTGLKSYVAGNIAVWLTQDGSGNFGVLPSLLSVPPGPVYYQTSDHGDVNCVVLNYMDPGTTLDMVVGTRTTDNTGTIEVWTNNGAGAFTQQEVYPTGGGFSNLGQVKGIALADLDADGDSDMVVVTRTGYAAGKLHIVERTGNTNNSRFNLRRTYDLGGEGNAVVFTDVDGDGRRDIIVGTHTGFNTGQLEYWHNDGSLNFSRAKVVDAPGIVLSLATADYGGLSRADLAVGWQTSETSNNGGVLIYLLDSGTVPATGTDPSSGTGANYMTPAMTVNNFNYGDNPLATGPQFPDLAVAQKPTTTTGQVVIFIR
jgi:prepilin-type N-terminal cleavage/methylation domain-containing protein